MKNYYIFLFILLICIQSKAQIKCSEADSDVNYGYSHVKSAYASNNISDLKYYAFRSLEALKRAENKLNECRCENAYSLSVDSIELLEKVELSETYEDGRFYVKRAKEKAQLIIGELDNCNQITVEEEELLELEMEQSQLIQQQRELEQKQEEIRLKMEAQKQEEVRLHKEMLVTNYESTIGANLKAFNQSLRIYGCYDTIEQEITSSDQLFLKSDDAIKAHYIDLIKKMSAKYLSKLDQCETR